MAQVHDRSQGHHGAAGGPGAQFAQAGLVVAERLVGLGQDLEGAAEQVEVVDEGGAQVGLQGAEHRGIADTEHLGLGAVDLGVEAWRLGAEAGEGPGDGVGLVGRVDQIAGDGLKLLGRGAGLVLHDHAEAAGGADAADRGRGDDPDIGAVNGRKTLLQVRDDARLRQVVRAAIFEGLQDQIDLAAVGGGGVAGGVDPGIDRGGLHARGGEDAGGDLAHDRVGAAQRSAGRQGGGDQQVALVLGRDEPARRVRQPPAGERDQAGIDDQHDHRHVDQLVGHAGIAVAEFVEAVVEQQPEALDRVAPPGDLMAFILVGPHQQGGQRRRQGQGHDQRDQRRRRDGQGELLVELAGDAADEGRRHEHRRQHQGDGHQGAADLVHGQVGRVLGGHARAKVSLDVFHHHDGVVDDDADGQHEPEQTEVVQ